MNLTYSTIRGKYGDKLDNLFQKKECLIQVNPGRVVLPKKFTDLGEQIINLPIRKDDIWLISYPRTGSTWAQEMIWLIGNDMDFVNAKQMQQIRTPLLELTAVMAVDHGDWLDQEIGNSVDHVENMKSIRYVKSHLPLELLPAGLATVKPKIIYIARNPKDMCVSYYHYCVLVHNMKESFDDFCELFINDMAPIGPVWNHILGFWRKRNEPNVFFIKYEDMKSDLRTSILKTAKFLNKTITEEDIKILIEHLSFKKMQNNPAVNLEPIIKKTNGEDFFEKTNQRFIRKGEVGDWKNYMTKEMSDKFDAWTEENLKGTGLTFD